MSEDTPHQDSPEVVTPDDVATPNPLEGLGVDVFIPNIEVRMVDAGALEDYEIWFGSASVLAAAAVGFIVAYIQSFSKDSKGVAHSDSTFLVVAILFGVFFLGAAIRTFVLRSRIKRKSRSYPMRVTGLQ